jgi:hypothetical protein
VNDALNQRQALRVEQREMTKIAEQGRQQRLLAAEQAQYDLAEKMLEAPDTEWKPHPTKGMGWEIGYKKGTSTQIDERPIGMKPEEGGTGGFTPSEKRVFDVLTKPQQIRIKAGLSKIQGLERKRQQGYQMIPDPATKTMKWEWVDPTAIDAEIQQIWKDIEATAGDEYSMQLLQEFAGEDFPLFLEPETSLEVVREQVQGDQFNLLK